MAKLGYASECYDAAGKRKLPNLTNVNLQKNSSSLKAKGISANFYISENLEVLKGHFPNLKILPGVLFAQMAANLIKKQESQFGKKVYVSEVTKFENKKPGFPGSHVQLEIQLTESNSHFKAWKVIARDKFKPKHVYSIGELKTRAVKSNYYKKTKAEETNRMPTFLYSTLETQAFLDHGKEIFFPIEVLGYENLENAKIGSKPSLENLDFLGHKVFTRIKIPTNHLLMEKLNSKISHLPLSNFSELASQVALFILKPQYEGKLPFQVLLRQVGEVEQFKPMFDGQVHYVNAEVESSVYMSKAKSTKTVFLAKAYNEANELVATAKIVGLISEKAKSN